MRQGRNKGSPPLGEWFGKTACILSLLGCLAAAFFLGGCQAKPTELRGKTAFGPEFRNQGRNTSEVRYTTQQGLEMKWDNGWTTATSFRRRDVDDGSGDNENRWLVEVGYPLWKAPKKEEKTTTQRIDELQEQVGEMRARVAALKAPANAEEARVAQAPDAGH